MLTTTVITCLSTLTTILLFIYLPAGQEVSQTIEQAISGNFMGKLIVQPHGCGEQTMIYMTLPVIATHYLDTTKQWEGVGVQRRSEAIQHIQTGEKTLPKTVYSKFIRFSKDTNVPDKKYNIQ